MLCRICGTPTSDKPLRVKEMMFGFREEFAYFVCPSCGCLQIDRHPVDMSKYYPSNYYSFRKRESTVRRCVRISRDRYAVFGKGLLGKAVYRRYPNPALQLLGANKPARDARILDVGSGSGSFLFALKDIGFTNLVGVDPYVGDDVAAGPVRIFRRRILDLPPGEKYDFIFFNHSLEHIWNQVETLSKTALVLTGDGVCILRMPVKTDAIWKRYGVDWWQIDAPRHFHIHTLQSFTLLARQCGLAVRKVIFDSTEFQFWVSEQYKRGIPLFSRQSNAHPKNKIFTAKQMRIFRKEARELNEIAEGDQATFLLAIQD